MKQYPLLTSKPAKFLFLLAMTALLFLSRDTVYTLTVLDVRTTAFITYGIMAMIGVAFLLRNRGQWKAIFTDKRIAWAVVSVILILLPMIAKADWQMMYFTVAICLLFSIFLTFVISFRDLGTYYVLIMCFVSINSLIGTYILKQFALSGIINPPMVYVSGWRELYHMGLSFVRPMDWYYRNYGIFREPGVYQFYLIQALLCNNFLLRWPKRWQYWLTNGILTVTMISTFATGGVIEMALLYVLLFFDKGFHKEKKMRRIIMAAVAVGTVILAGMLIYSESVRNMVWGMFEKLFVRTHSSIARIDAIWIDLEIFLRNPVFGDKLAFVLSVVDNNTTSTMILFAAYGTLVGLVHVLSWATLVWDRNRHLLLNLGLLLVMLMSFNTQNLTPNQFFWLFSWMALTERGIPAISSFLETRKEKKQSQGN